MAGSMPTFTRARVMVLALGAIVLALGVAVVLSITGATRWPRWLWLSLCVAPGLVGWGASIALIVWSRRLRRRAREHRGAVCWGCGYVLGGLADRGVCPECGAAFDLGQLRRLWGVQDVSGL